MQTITDGISREGWKFVEEAVSQMLAHPQPPFVKYIQILSFVGSNCIFWPIVNTHSDPS